MRLRSIGTHSGKSLKPIHFVSDRLVPITFIFLSLALLYSSLSISDLMTERAKIQENALLAGLVEENWNESVLLYKTMRELKEKIGKSRRNLRDFISKSLVDVGIEVSHQRSNSIHFMKRHNSSLTYGENVYGIVRAFRTTPAESILLAVPMRSSHIESIAIAIAFAHYAKNQNYWARDLIFLFVDGGDKNAIEAWLSTYHGHASNFLGQSANEEELTLHGGSIIGAFALDLIGSTFSQVDIQYGMINGKLPNMDLLNLFVLLVEKAGTTATIHGVLQHRGRTSNEEDNEYSNRAKTVIKRILDQSLNEMESLTSMFGRYGVHAVTLSARPIKANEKRRHHQQQPSTIVDLSDIVHVVEGGMRSLNNLLEKLHHSYLLYILTSPNRFISVSLYMPVMVFLLLPLLAMAICEWFRMGGAGQLVSVGPAIVKLSFSHLPPLAFYGSLLYLFADARFSAFRPYLVLFTLFSFLAIPFLCFFFPISGSSANLHFSRFTIAIELSLFLGSLSLVHFSLALLLSVLLLPQSILVLLLPSKCSKWRRALAFLSTHPLLISTLLFFSWNYDPEQGINAEKCWRKVSTQVTRTIFAHLFHGSWLMPILSGPFLTICSAINQILANNCVEEEKEEENGSDKRIEITEEEKNK